jgi:predicted Zn-dependent peptidase
MKEVKHKRLPNGFDIYTQVDHNTHLMGVGVKSGGFFDPKNKVGLAHFVEHIVARGPRNSDSEEIDRRLRELGCGPGAGIDIHTTFQHTFYGTDMLRTRKFSEEIFNIFARMVTNTCVNKVGMEVEFGAVKTEYLYHGQDNMQDQIFRMLAEQIFTHNPVRRRLDCELSHLEKMTMYDVNKFIRQHYIPNNMFAVILGPTHNKAVDLAKRYFSDLTPGLEPDLDYGFEDHYPRLEPKELGDHSILRIKPGLDTYHVGIGFPVEPYTPGVMENGEAFEHARDAVAVEVLAEVLEHRMHQQLRETGKSTYHPYAFLERSSIAGMLYIWFPTMTESLAYENIERAVKDFERIKQGGITQSEYEQVLSKAPRKNGHKLRKVNNLFGVEIPPDISLETAKGFLKKHRQILQRDNLMGVNALKTNHWESFQTTSSYLVERIIDATCSGDVEAEWVNRRNELLDRVGIKKLVDIANKVLTPEYALAVIKPVPIDVIDIPNFYKETVAQRKLPF